MWKLLSRDPAPGHSGAGPAGIGSEGAARASGYDRVGIVEGGEIQWLSQRQFQGLALTERVRLLAGGGLRFYRGTVQITPSEAMRGLP
jgi:hypothetical protein